MRLLAGAASIVCTAASASWPTIGATVGLQDAGGRQLGPSSLCAAAALASGTGPRAARSGIRRLAAPITNGPYRCLSASAWAPLPTGDAAGGREEDGRSEECTQATRRAAEEVDSSHTRPQEGVTRGSGGMQVRTRSMRSPSICMLPSRSKERERMPRPAEDVMQLAGDATLGIASLSSVVFPPGVRERDAMQR